MFTGIIEQIGTLKLLRSGKIQVQSAWNEPLVLGESIAVQGACLTVARIIPDGFEADVLDETIKRTALATLPLGAKLNLERAMRLSDRFGGHFVTGHVDFTAKVTSIRAVGANIRISFRVPREALIILKGSVAVDGISLTVTEADYESFSVDVIPHTLRNTSLSERIVGGLVNIETDVLGKYAAAAVKR